MITVPAYFNDNQRQATKDAGEIAGLEVVRLVNEPTAASLAYGLDKGGKDMRVMVYDLGGGTLDVTIMEFGKGVFEVKSTSGDTQLGGTDMDNAIVDFLANEFKSQTGVDVKGSPQAMQRLREAGEKAKIELSSTLSTEINLPFFSQDKNGKPLNFTYSFTRAKLESLVVPIIEKSTKPVMQALKDAKLEPSGSGQGHTGWGTDQDAHSAEVRGAAARQEDREGSRPDGGGGARGGGAGWRPYRGGEGHSPAGRDPALAEH